MKLFLSVLMTIVLACPLSFSGSTKYASTYINPRANMAELAGKKIACFVVIPSEELRSAREETVAAELRSRGMDAIAGSDVLPGVLVKDREKSKEFLKKAGIGGVILFRLVGDEKETKYSTATVYSQPYYSNFWGYWNYGWSNVYVYETQWTERVVTLETMIYSLENDELIWAGRSATTSPKDIRKFVKELANAAGKELRKVGLIRK